MPLDTLFIFLDEGGNFDFSNKGSEYFTLTSVATTRPFVFATPLIDLRCSLLESGLNLEYFHASEDKQAIRDKVFGVISSHMTAMRFDSVIVKKRMTMPSLHVEEKFYPKMLGYLLRYVMNGCEGQYSHIVVMTDSIPVKRKKDAIEKAVKLHLSQQITTKTPYNIYHHASKSSVGLQVADYVNWAIGRKWERGDTRSYDIIKPSLKSEFDIFQHGSKTWY